MRIFVTGGAGFIGSNFLRLAIQRDYEVTVFDSLTYAGNLSTLRDVETSRQYSFIQGDICDLPFLTDAMKGHDTVVHFAAESHVDRSISGPHDFVRTNCMGTNNVLFAAQQLGVERVVHVSTDEVYGQILEGSFRETDAVAPRSPYSASKAGSDLLALSYFSTYGTPVVVTRSSNNFGPFQHPEKLIGRFVTNLLCNQNVPLYGDGLNVRDWIYVEDNCAAIELVMRSGEVGEIYNIGGGQEITNRDMTERILSIMGYDESRIEPVSDRLGHDRRYSIDASKMQALGWKPENHFDDALRATVQWYTDNRWWWEPLKTGS